MSGNRKLIEIYRNMTPEERIKKGWELTEWCIKFNPEFEKEIERRKNESYSLE